MCRQELAGACISSENETETLSTGPAAECVETFRFIRLQMCGKGRLSLTLCNVLPQNCPRIPEFQILLQKSAAYERGSPDEEEAPGDFRISCFASE